MTPNTPMTVTGTRLVDGGTLALENLVSVEITAALSSPAHSARIVAGMDRFPGELGEIEIYQGREILFSGRVDKQTASISGAGRLLTVDARSRGALLLDNEALPCVLTNVRLSTVFQIFASPYGFLLQPPAASGTLSLYTVSKGQSEWEAIASFCQRVYGRSPRLEHNVISVDPLPFETPLIIGSAGLAYTQLEHAYIPYQTVSKIVIRDENGLYSTAVHNSAAAYAGVQRKRYIIPATEFIEAPGPDANERIRRSMLQSESARATLPGLVDIPPGREVRFADSALTRTNLLAEEVTWRQDQGGLSTALSLVSSIYYQ